MLIRFFGALLSMKLTTGTLEGQQQDSPPNSSFTGLGHCFFPPAHFLTVCPVVLRLSRVGTYLDLTEVAQVSSRMAHQHVLLPEDFLCLLSTVSGVWRNIVGDSQLL